MGPKYARRQVNPASSSEQPEQEPSEETSWSEEDASGDSAGGSGGSRTMAANIGQKGVIVSFGTHFCMVQLDGGELTVKMKTDLHLLEDGGEQPTVPLADVKRMKAKEFWAWLQKYKADNNVQLIEGCSEEASWDAHIAEYEKTLHG